MILVCGDCLIDFMPARTADGRDAYVPAVGGSCLNIATAVGRLDVPAGFVGGVSSDMFGEMIVGHMTASKVDVSRVTRSARATTLAFVRYEGTSARYAFYDEGSAARMWTFAPAKVPLAGVRALHFGSTTLINEPSAGETKRLVEAARATATITFDPNCRPGLIADVGAYRRAMESLVALADIVKVSTEDLDYLRPGAATDDAASQWLEGGASLVVVTDGAAGATAYARAGKLHRPAHPTKLVDTIGAGDTFHAALLVNLYERNTLSRERLGLLTKDQIGAALDFAAAAAAITCARPGADPPWRKEMAG
jgi:fructokinase